jgi:GT2 family glycosyltransferase
MQNKRVAIVILNWNKFEYSKNCIQSLKNSNFNDFDIIFIDNGSSDFSGKRINDEFPEIIFIELSTNLGFAGGNNIGLQFAVKKNYEYVMMLNNDVYVDKNFLFHLINYLDFHCEAGAVQSLIFNHPNRQCVWNGGGKFFK